MGGLWGGWTWWDVVDSAYRDRIYRPADTSAEAVTTGDGRVLTLTVDDPSWRGRDWTPLMSDHGKLMHMFLVRDDDLSAFAHVHPTSTDSTSFDVVSPHYQRAITVSTPISCTSRVSLRH